MGLMSRVINGAIHGLTATGRAAFTPFTYAWEMAKTAFNSLGKLAQLDVTGAAKELVGGTIKNTARAGLNIAEGGMPALAFAEGFVRDKSSTADVAKQVITKLV
ncbi:MAG: hypothetical protein IT383_19275 [Deltaproteobacteria bacterium]|nr:hypothetical protein [Deltaproteobacteria bacterium]